MSRNCLLEPEDRNKIFRRREACSVDTPVEQAASCLSKLDGDDAMVTSARCNVSNKASGALRQIPALTRQKEKNEISPNTGALYL